MRDSLLGFICPAANNELQGNAVPTPKPISAFKKSRRGRFRQPSWLSVLLGMGATKRDALRGAILLLTSIGTCLKKTGTLYVQCEPESILISNARKQSWAYSR
jgi:hypothetical protein